MTHELAGFVSGCILVVLVSACTAWIAYKQLRENWKRGIVVDRTQSEFHKDERPFLFCFQMVAFVVFIGVTALAGVAAVIALSLKLMAK